MSIMGRIGKNTGKMKPKNPLEAQELCSCNFRSLCSAVTGEKPNPSRTVHTSSDL